jgi:hypothetical protein
MIIDADDGFAQGDKENKDDESEDNDIQEGRSNDGMLTFLSSLVYLTTIIIIIIHLVSKCFYILVLR